MALSEVRDLCVTFLTQSWVAESVKRSRTFGVKHWNGDPYAVEMDKAPIGVGGRFFSDQSPVFDHEKEESFHTRQPTTKSKT